MKKCKKCGALQSDDRMTCLDCGAVLGKPLSEAEKYAEDVSLHGQLDDLSEKAEDFHVSGVDRIFGITAIVACAVLIVMLNIVGVRTSQYKSQIPDNVYISTGNGFTSIMGSGDEEYRNSLAVTQSILRKVDHLSETGGYALIGLICFISSALLFLIPKIVWYLETARYRIWFSSDPSPSYYALTMYKIIKYAMFAAGASLLVITILRLF